MFKFTSDVTLRIGDTLLFSKTQPDKSFVCKVTQLVRDGAEVSQTFAYLEYFLAVNKNFSKGWTVQKVTTF
jgi:hypothetical protein